MIDSLTQIISVLSQTLPLEAMALFIGIISEAIPPIPSFPMLVTLGAFAKAQAYSLPAIFTLALFSAAGKTLIGIFIYILVDKAEDVFIAKYGAYFNIKPGQLEAFGEKFGKRKSDYFFLTLIRSIPFLSSTIITVAAGVVRIPFKLFVTTAFFGYFIQDSLYIYIGFTGINGFRHYFDEILSLNIFIKCSIIIAVISLLVYLYLRQRSKLKAKNTQL